jgi:hypothetical protein
MIKRRLLLGIFLSASVLVGGGFAFAKSAHHMNGHNLLGDKLNQDGKHEFGKAGNNTVTAEVNNKKIVNMSAGNLPVRKVKSTKKMASLDQGRTRLAANGPIQLAQNDVYYGYCFDTATDEYCYWYTATDVIVTDTWIEYVPL